VSVALVIGHAKRMYRIILSSVACLAVTYFSTLYHKRQDFRKIVIEYKICILGFPMFETFLVLRKIQRDVPRSSCKVLVILVRFNETSIFLRDFRKLIKYQIS
jgi:hypothetical protein